MAVVDSPFALPAGRLLAIDPGEARVGLAVCDELGIIATPLGIMRRHPTVADDFTELARIASEQRAAGILIGMPLDSRGRIGSQGKRVRRYALRFARTTHLPVAFWDESYSTVDAGVLLRGSKRTEIDAAAAAVMLNEFLEARRRRSEPQR
jgi:putative Holliday junction resolvase